MIEFVLFIDDISSSPVHDTMVPAYDEKNEDEDDSDEDSDDNDSSLWDHEVQISQRKSISDLDNILKNKNTHRAFLPWGKWAFILLGTYVS